MHVHFEPVDPELFSAYYENTDKDELVAKYLNEKYIPDWTKKEKTYTPSISKVRLA
jgi:hypothetical protein